MSREPFTSPRVSHLTLAHARVVCECGWGPLVYSATSLDVAIGRADRALYYHKENQCELIHGTRSKGNA